MFYPKLTRRKENEYYSSRGAFYADYLENFDKVSEDCQYRCIYCDILNDEMGGESMQLDHFRPQKYFDNLKTSPFNLYLSCPKCNRLKSDDWPCSKNEEEPSFVGRIGYLDPMLHTPSDYLYVDENGEVISKGGPVNYIVKRLMINRTTRKYIRKKRVLEFRKKSLSKKITVILKGIQEDLRSGSDIDLSKIKNKIDIAIEVKEILDNMI